MSTTETNPLFSHPDAVYGPDYLRRVFDWGSASERDILIGHEIIDRTGERIGSLERAMKEAPWFF
ncbi:MAG: hypothetical protein SPK11_06595 [Bullifex sp.]|nr:hypothetical protein [Spirochaetales bacterium]MDY2816707.1 hypothetical protein [Bullifex sp.]MDY5908474.1 hypothetical protein [Bullifex sp.]